MVAGHVFPSFLSKKRVDAGDNCHVNPLLAFWPYPKCRWIFAATDWGRDMEPSSTGSDPLPGGSAMTCRHVAALWGCICGKLAGRDEREIREGMDNGLQV